MPTLAEVRAALARRSLLRFTEYTNPLYRRAQHHEQIAAKLEAVERGEIDRLMIFMPPRHGKSELASKRFPAWCLGRKPERQIIAASYNSDLANDFGRNVRNLVAEPEFQQVFPGVALAPDSQAANRMNTNLGGAYVAAGVGTAVTGRGAHIALIDDPFKDREEADSERRRDVVWDWYRSTLYTRLMPGGAVVIIATRWHEGDLAGRLLEQERDQWDVLELPALNKAGEALWPEWYPVDTLERIKATIGPREWSALYQQQPQPDAGTYFIRDWFDGRRWRDLPAHLHLYGTSDYATKDGSGDYTVHHVWGVDPQGDLYLVDRWRGQTTSDVWIERLCDLIALHKPLAWFCEAGPIWRAVEPAVMRRFRERNVYCRLESMASVHDKPTSARGFQARAARKCVWLPDTPEGEAVLDELLRFPAGKYDDEVDCVVAETMIAMRDGSRKRADEIRPGDVVKTPQGGQEVLDWQLTVRNSRTFTVTLDTGETLCASPNHPIALENGSFVRLDSLKKGARVITESGSWQSASHTTAEPIGAILKAAMPHTAATFRPGAAKGFSTAMFGQTVTAQFRRAWSFTISTATPATMILRTLRALRRLNIAANTPLAKLSARSCACIWTLFGQRQPLGTPAMLAGHGIRNTQGSSPQSDSRWITSAGAVQSPSRASRFLPSFALPLAALNSVIAAPIKAMSLKRAPWFRAITAGLSSGERTPSRSGFARRGASAIIEVRETARRDVFNLAVANEHVFYANGILTHNCCSKIGRALDEAHPAVVPIKAVVTAPPDLHRRRPGQGVQSAFA